jgi:hypothetical protein
MDHLEYLYVHIHILWIGLVQFPMPAAATTAAFHGLDVDNRS